MIISFSQPKRPYFLLSEQGAWGSNLGACVLLESTSRAKGLK